MYSVVYPWSQYRGVLSTTCLLFVFNEHKLLFLRCCYFYSSDIMVNHAYSKLLEFKSLICVSSYSIEIQTWKIHELELDSTMVVMLLFKISTSGTFEQLKCSLLLRFCPMTMHPNFVLQLLTFYFITNINTYTNNVAKVIRLTNSDFFMGSAIRSHKTQSLLH